MSLPILISVPHAGTQIPPEVAALNLLTIDQIIKDGDEGAREIFDFKEDVVAFVTTDIARAYLDMNRAENDRGPDGVVKTETIYREPVFSKPLDGERIQQLLSRYYTPYHQELSRLAHRALLGIDCHTMAAVAPPICADAGTTRPLICLSDGEGTCPKKWTKLMAECLGSRFGLAVSINSPFKGGQIIRSHAHELPWMQLELSRATVITREEKKRKVSAAFRDWCYQVHKLKTVGKD